MLIPTPSSKRALGPGCQSKHAHGEYRNVFSPFAVTVHRGILVNDQPYSIQGNHVPAQVHLFSGSLNCGIVLGDTKCSQWLEHSSIEASFSYFPTEQVQLQGSSVQLRMKLTAGVGTSSKLACRRLLRKKRERRCQSRDRPTAAGFHVSSQEENTDRRVKIKEENGPTIPCERKTVAYRSAAVRGPQNHLPHFIDIELVCFAMGENKTNDPSSCATSEHSSNNENATSATIRDISYTCSRRKPEELDRGVVRWRLG